MKYKSDIILTLEEIRMMKKMEEGMHKNTAKHKGSRRHTDYDLKNDFENIKAAFVEAREDIKGRAGEILSQSLDDVKDTSLDVKDSVEDYINKKPFQSLGIAMAAGLLVGYLMRK